MTKKALQYFCDKMFINIGQNYVTIKNGVYMKLLHKLLLGYIFIIVIIGSFSTFALIYGIQKSSHNLSIYREREITSFVHVVDAFIVNEESLEDLDGIESLFISITKKLPHIKRITLHLQDKNTSEYSHVVSTVLSHKNLPSHQEDIDAIVNNKTTILYETGDSDEKYIDITYPITNEDGKAIASMGVAVLLTESDAVLQKAIDAMKEEAVVSVLIAILFSLLIASVFVIIMTRKIIAPLEILKTATRSISKNEEYETIEISTNDELGELASAFNKMANELLSNPAPNPILPEFLRVLGISAWQKLLVRHSGWQEFVAFEQILKAVEEGQLDPKDGLQMIIQKYAQRVAQSAAANSGDNQNGTRNSNGGQS